MSQCVLAQLDVSSRVSKRAQYEAFEFEIRSGGVLVRNTSYAKPSKHEYVVTLRDGVPATCECPADARFDGACKHRVAVAIRRPVLDAARGQPVAADGGTVGDGIGHGDARADADDPPPEAAADGESEACAECAALPHDFPCWECVRTGRRDIPD